MRSAVPSTAPPRFRAFGLRRESAAMCGGGAGDRTYPLNDRKPKRRTNLHGHHGNLGVRAEAGEGGWELVRSGESGSSGRQAGDRTSARCLAKFRRQDPYPAALPTCYSAPLLSPTCRPEGGLDCGTDGARMQARPAEWLPKRRSHSLLRT